MLAGRFLMIVPALGIAGSMVGKKIVPPRAGHVPDQRLALHRAARRRDRHRRRADVLPGALARADRRALRRRCTARCSSHVHAPKHSRSRCSIATIVARGDRRQRSRSSHPRHVAKNPVMFVVEIGSVLTTLVFVRDLAAPRERGRAALVHGRGHALAVVHRALRQLRRGGRRGPRQGAGRHAAQDAQGDRSRGKLVDGTRRAARSSRRRRCARATSSSSRPASSSPATARSSRASPRSTSRRSPASRRRSSARAAATARPSPAARRCSPTASSCASPPIPGESFLDRMIALVEGAARQKTPNEIALHILLVGLTIVFLFACVTLVPLAHLLGHRACRRR